MYTMGNDLHVHGIGVGDQSIACIARFLALSKLVPTTFPNRTVAIELYKYTLEILKKIVRRKGRIVTIDVHRCSMYARCSDKTHISTSMISRRQSLWQLDNTSTHQPACTRPSRSLARCKRILCLGPGDGCLELRDRDIRWRACVTITTTCLGLSVRIRCVNFSF